MGLNPHAPVPSLLTSLKRAEWGDLAGREWQGVRSTLEGLTAQLPHASGQGRVTIAQIAGSTGLSSRWVARCLQVLEDLGVITWRRGGAIAGEPIPSFIRIVKTRLVELIAAARPSKNERAAVRHREVRQRIAHLRFVYGRSRRSVHVELSAHLPSPSGEGLTSSFPTGVDKYVPTVCQHGGDGGRLADGQLRCPSCRRQGVTT